MVNACLPTIHITIIAQFIEAVTSSIKDSIKQLSNKYYTLFYFSAILLLKKDNAMKKRLWFMSI